MKMSEQARAARREYARKWRGENRDKTKQYTAKHWEKVAAQQKHEASKEGN